MNRIINKSLCASIAVATGLMAASCGNDNFNLFPTDSMQIETYLTNDEEVQNVLLDNYYYLRTVSQNLIYINSLATDEAYDWQKNNSNDHISLNLSTWNATLGLTDEVWSDSYKIINRSNNVLEHLSRVSEQNRSRYEGEALFFRAYAYFNLVRLFGAVPLTTSVVTNYASLYDYDRSPVDKVYAQIDADVARAVELLPQQIKNASETGRATSIAALALQGKALLTQGEYSGAESALKRIIDFSQANPDLLGLEDDPSQIYASDNAIGKEVIFAAQFNNGSTVINNPLMKATIPAGVPQSQPSYVYPDGTASTIKTSVGNSTLLMTWELFNALRADKADKRYQQLSYNGIYDNGSLSRQTDEVDTTPEGYAYMPITLKYYDFANQGLTTDRSSNDNIIFRYADVLLEYAEVLNSTGRADEALAYLNQVRRRAGVADVAGTEQLALAIENERLLELNFEGHRWFDLVRTGRITSVMEAHFAHRTQGLSATLQVSDNGLTVENEQSVSGTPVKWKWSGQQTAVLFPIPYSQIQLNPNWQQNDLY